MHEPSEKRQRMESYASIENNEELIDNNGEQIENNEETTSSAIVQKIRIPPVEYIDDRYKNR